MAYHKEFSGLLSLAFNFLCIRPDAVQIFIFVTIPDTKNKIHMIWL